MHSKRDPEQADRQREFMETFRGEGYGVLELMDCVSALADKVYGETAANLMLQAWLVANGQSTDKFLCAVCEQPWSLTRAPTSLGFLAPGRKPKSAACFAICGDCDKDRDHVMRTLQNEFSMQMSTNLRDTSAERVGHG